MRRKQPRPDVLTGVNWHSGDVPAAFNAEMRAALPGFDDAAMRPEHTSQVLGRHPSSLYRQADYVPNGLGRCSVRSRLQILRCHGCTKYDRRHSVIVVTDPLRRAPLLVAVAGYKRQ